MSEKEEKRGGQRPRKSKRKRKKENKAEGLSKKKKRSTKCLCMPKAYELKEKLREAQSA